MKQSPPSFNFRVDRGIKNIEVELWDPQDPQQAANVIASFYLSTWGDPKSANAWYDEAGGQSTAWAHAQEAASGTVLPNTLESLALTYSINGVARATTHQLVRSRVGAVFGQQGGRDNNWSQFNQRLPETWFRNPRSNVLVKKAREVQIQANELYELATAFGIPFQDARYVLPMGLETALVASYNLLALKGLAERRLCNRMMWETNHVVRLMCDLAVKQYPWVGRNLRSSCEKRGVCGSVSPMFPPACVTLGQANSDPVTRFAKDNPTLSSHVLSYGYDFPMTANGCYFEYVQKDEIRLKQETMDHDVVISLLDGQTVLAKKDRAGMWRNAYGD